MKNDFMNVFCLFLIETMFYQGQSIKNKRMHVRIYDLIIYSLLDRKRSTLVSNSWGLRHPPYTTATSWTVTFGGQSEKNGDLKLKRQTRNFFAFSKLVFKHALSKN